MIDGAFLTPIDHKCVDESFVYQRCPKCGGGMKAEIPAWTWSCRMCGFHAERGVLLSENIVCSKCKSYFRSSPDSTKKNKYCPRCSDLWLINWNKQRSLKDKAAGGRKKAMPAGSGSISSSGAWDKPVNGKVKELAFGVGGGHISKNRWLRGDDIRWGLMMAEACHA